MKVGQKEAWRPEVCCLPRCLGWLGRVCRHVCLGCRSSPSVLAPLLPSAQGDHSLRKTLDCPGIHWGEKTGLLPSLPLLPAETSHTHKSRHSHPGENIASRSGKSPWPCGGRGLSRHSDCRGSGLSRRRTDKQKQSLCGGARGLLSGPRRSCPRASRLPPSRAKRAPF